MRHADNNNNNNFSSHSTTQVDAFEVASGAAFAEVTEEPPSKFGNYKGEMLSGDLVGVVVAHVRFQQIHLGVLGECESSSILQRVLEQACPLVWQPLIPLSKAFSYMSDIDEDIK